MLFVHMRCSNAFHRHFHEGNFAKHKMVLEHPDTSSCLSAEYLPANSVVLLGLPSECSHWTEIWLFNLLNVPLVLESDGPAESNPLLLLLAGK